jgi:hypothetical protein
MALNDREAVDLRAKEALRSAHQTLTHSLHANGGNLTLAFRSGLRKAERALTSRLIELYSNLDGASDKQSSAEYIAVIVEYVTAFIASAKAGQRGNQSAAASRDAAILDAEARERIPNAFDLAVHDLREQARQKKTLHQSPATSSAYQAISDPSETTSETDAVKKTEGNRSESPWMRFARGPLEALPTAIKNVPSVKYGLGTLGVAGCVAAALGYFKSPQIAIVGIIAGFALMGLMFIFAKVAALGPRPMHWPAVIFVWFCLLLFICWAGAMTTSVFFGHPLKISLFSSNELGTLRYPTITGTQPPSAKRTEGAPV